MNNIRDHRGFDRSTAGGVSSTSSSLWVLVGKTASSAATTGGADGVSLGDDGFGGIAGTSILARSVTWDVAYFASRPFPFTRSMPNGVVGACGP